MHPTLLCSSSPCTNLSRHNKASSRQRTPCQERPLSVPRAAPLLQEPQQSQCSRRNVLSLISLLPFPLLTPEARAGPSDLPPTSSPIPEGNATSILEADVAKLTASEKQVYNFNRRIQVQNRVPQDFPGFIRKGFDVLVVGDGYSTTPNGLIYKDFKLGEGPQPVQGQEVLFNYNGYNESGAIIDSSYRKGRAAQTRLGVNGLIPGFEEGIRGMRAGQQRRIIVPPALGPPVGPSTFFSAKQCEVFDVELITIRSCERRQVAMFSDVVCTDI